MCNALMNMHEDFNTLQKPVNIEGSASLIGESMSEPHTSEFNGGISLIYICIAHCTSNARVCVPNAGNVHVI